MRSRAARLLLVNLALFALTAMLSPNFLRPGNLIALANNMALEAVALSAVSLLMIGGLLDLSMDGVVAMAGVVAGWLLTKGQAPALAIVGGVGSGVAFGALNGLAVNRFRLNPLVTTLATGWIAYGIAYGITQGKSFYALPAGFQVVGQTGLFGVKIGVGYAVLMVAVLSFVLYRTTFGAHTLLVGDNPDSCRMMGIDVSGVRLRLYLLAGFASGVAGVVLAARLDAATPIAADGMALRVIAAAVIGGCSLSGGYGSVAGGVLGLVLMNTLSNAAVLLGIDVYWQKSIVGLVLLSAIVLDASGGTFSLGRLIRSKR